MGGKESAGSLVTLEGRTALVTGASGGIGAAITALLARCGARVVGMDLPGKRIPGADAVLPCDLGRPETIPDLGRELDRLDVVVHGAGIRRDAVLWKMEDEAWSDVMRVNLDSAFHLLKRAAPLLRRQGGSVVLISSINGERGKFGQANYAASKAGLIGLARTAAREMGRFGVRVNVVAPGLIRTPMTESMPEEAFRESVAESLLGRAGEPEDVAAAVLYLCSEMGRHVTGQVIRVDGGQLVA